MIFQILFFGTFYLGCIPLEEINLWLMDRKLAMCIICLCLCFILDVMAVIIALHWYINQIMSSINTSLGSIIRIDNSK